MNSNAQDQSADSVADGSLPAEAGRMAQDEVLAAIRSRLDAAARHDLQMWVRFVADDGPPSAALPFSATPEANRWAAHANAPSPCLLT